MSKDFRYNKKELDVGFEDNMYLENQGEGKSSYTMKKAKKARMQQAKARRNQFNQLH